MINPAEIPKKTTIFDLKSITSTQNIVVFTAVTRPEHLVFYNKQTLQIFLLFINL